MAEQHMDQDLYCQDQVWNSWKLNLRVKGTPPNPSRNLLDRYYEQGVGVNQHCCHAYYSTQAT